MNCPVCENTTLTMSERQGIEIDYCPKCRGVWLDRGELDKIIEKAVMPLQVLGGSDRREHDDHKHYDHKQYDHKPYKKKSIWHEIFD
jgi:uncharacterized protein